MAERYPLYRDISNRLKNIQNKESEVVIIDGVPIMKKKLRKHDSGKVVLSLGTEFAGRNGAEMVIFLREGETVRIMGMKNSGDRITQLSPKMLKEIITQIRECEAAEKI